MPLAPDISSSLSAVDMVMLRRLTGTARTLSTGMGGQVRDIGAAAELIVALARQVGRQVSQPAGQPAEQVVARLAERIDRMAELVATLAPQVAADADGAFAILEELDGRLAMPRPASIVAVSDTADHDVVDDGLPSRGPSPVDGRHTRHAVRLVAGSDVDGVLDDVRVAAKPKHCRSFPRLIAIDATRGS